MNGLDALKCEAASLIGAPCMVQRDRTGRALFFSDYGRRGIQGAADRLRRAGFVAEEKDGCAYIALSEQKAEQFLLSLTDSPAFPASEDDRLLMATGHMLLRHKERACLPAQDVLHRALLYWDAGQKNKLALLLQTELSLALRTKSPVPVLLARLCCSL